MNADKDVITGQIMYRVYKKCFSDDLATEEVTVARIVNSTTIKIREDKERYEWISRDCFPNILRGIPENAFVSSDFSSICPDILFFTKSDAEEFVKIQNLRTWIANHYTSNCLYGLSYEDLTTVRDILFGGENECK